MKDLFRYNKPKKRKNEPWKDFAYLLLGFFFLFFSYDLFTVDRGLHLVTAVICGFLCLTMAIFIIMISISTISLYYSKYLHITEEKIMWKNGLMKPNEELLLEKVESFTILEDTIRINQKEGKLIIFDKSNIRSTKKKKELERVLRKINKDNQFV